MHDAAGGSARGKCLREAKCATRVWREARVCGRRREPKSATRVCAKCATRVCADTEDRRSGLACDMVWCSRRRARGGGAASVLQEAVERERERERERGGGACPDFAMPAVCQERFYLLFRSWFGLACKYCEVCKFRPERTVAWARGRASGR